MAMSRIRLVPIVLVAIVALAVLFGGWEFYQQYSVVTPLQTGLKSIKGVKTSNIRPGNPSTVDVTLGSVTDLQTTYKEILSKAQEDIHGTIDINVSGKSDKTLNQEYEDIQPVLMEGVAKGNFTQMIQSVKKMAQAKGITAKITMDPQHIFVQMTKGNNQLYSIVSYSLQQGGGVS